MGCTREITGVELAETAMTLRAKGEDLSSLKTTPAKTKVIEKVLEDFIVKKESGEDVYLTNAGIDEECIKRLLAYDGRDALRWRVNWIVGRTDIYNAETPMSELDWRKVEALGEIKDYIVIQPLLAALKWDDIFIADTAEKVFSEIFDEAIKGWGIEKGAIICELAKATSTARWGNLELFSTKFSKPITQMTWEEYEENNNDEVTNMVKKARSEMIGLIAEDLTKKLKDDNPFEAIAALEKLAELGIEPLLKAKKTVRFSSDLPLDRAIPEVILRKQLIPNVAALLNSKNVFVQSDAKDLLTAIIVSPNTEITQKRELASKLVSLLKTDVDASVQLDAQELLIKIGAPAVDELIKKLGDDSFDSIDDTLAEIGPPAVDSLLRALRDKKITYEARHTLAEIGKKDKGTIGKLRDEALKQFNDTDTFQHIIGVLGDIGGEVAKATLKDIGIRALENGKNEIAWLVKFKLDDMPR